MKTITQNPTDYLWRNTNCFGRGALLLALLVMAGAAILLRGIKRQ